MEQLSLIYSGYRIGYIRTSESEPSPETQLKGLMLDNVYTDTTSGKNLQKPQLQAALGKLMEGDTLVVDSMDRLAGSLKELLELMEKLTREGIKIQFIKENLTFSPPQEDPSCAPMLSLLAAAIRFEHSKARERQREGIVMAKANGIYKGRKPKLTKSQATEIRERVIKGEAKASIARHYKISRETLYKYLQA